jgi:hypothetical protein
MRNITQYDGTILTISDLSRSPLLHSVCVRCDLATLQMYLEMHLLSLYGPRQEFGVMAVGGK